MFEEKGVELLLWDWEKFDELLTTPNINLDKMKISFVIDNPEKELLRRKSPMCIIKGSYLVDAWNEYQWNLVDWNVRAEIRNSPTNKRIQDTLKKPAGRRHFQDFNNGLLIVCRQVTYKNLRDNKVELTLRQPQVVNGCQTLLSLVHAYIDLPEKEKDEFNSTVQVQLKIIQNQSPQYVDQVIRSTNDQNPMTPRSLKSNAIEQIKFQERFSKYNIKYFYERKDGQFEGLLNFGHKIPSFRPRDYRIKEGRKKYRTLDNEKLAKEWLAFIGHSHETLRGGIKLFDNDELYRRAFLERPNEKYWEICTRTPAISPPVDKEECFDDNSASVSQLLLAHTVANYVKQRRVSYKKNRDAAIQRLVDKKVIELDNSGNPKEDSYLVDSKLLNDDEYQLGIMINNMQDVLIELYAMVITMKYGALNERLCTKLIKHPSIRMRVEDPFANAQQDAMKAESKDIMALIYEFLLFSIGQYVLKYGDSIKSKPRLKSYLAQRTTIDSIREFSIMVNEEKVPKWVEEWCPGSVPFTEVLPILTCPTI